MRICLSLFFCVINLVAEKALVVVPVADLIFTPYGKNKNDLDVLESYKQLACGDECCDRAYQLLFNEVVEIEEYFGQEVKIKVPHIIYFDLENKIYSNSYWTLSSNLINFNKLQDADVNLNYIPKMVYWNRLDLSYCSKNIITLTMPFIDSEPRLIYSAGTRFVVDENGLKDHDEFIDIWILSPVDLKLKKVKLPKNICKMFEHKSLDARISDYVNLLRKWTKLSEGFIPYVYSGSSFTVATQVDQFKVKEDEEKSCAFYWRNEFSKMPYAGFDCSCIISRAAQICGIAYFYKDSHTLIRNLDSLQEDDVVEEGDIIWFSGHVMIVSDVKNNLVIESRGYASGFGKTHEINLNQIFAEINNYQELVSAHLNKYNLKLLARDGSLRYIIEQFKILKFKSYANFALRR